MGEGDEEVRGSWAFQANEPSGEAEAEAEQTRTYSAGPPIGPEPTERPPRPKGTRVLTVGIVSAALAAGAVGGVIGVRYLGTTLGQQRATTSVPSTSPPVSSGGGSVQSASASSNLNVSQVSSKVSPGVVDINTVLGVTGAIYGEAAGTGMIISSSGEILTNNHVVAGASTIRVTIPSQGHSYKASVVGVDPSLDVALLKINATGLHPVSIGNSSTAAVGQPVVAIGNALGLGGNPTVTSGIVSSLNRSITASSPAGPSEHLTGLIQTDAPINPGNSGGPLANASGQVIGMNTAAATGGTQTGTNIGFAIPINRAMSVVNHILAGNTSGGIMLGRPGFLGVVTAPTSSFFASQYGGNVPQGAVVQDVVPNSPAANAGIAPGDAIVGLGGKTVTSPSSLSRVIDAYRPGSSVQISWIGPQGRQTSTVRLATGLAV